MTLINPLFVCILLLPSLGYSEENKISVQRFSQGDLIPLNTKLRFTTLVVFPEGEEIVEVTCGDKEYWVIDGNDNILHVKPAKEGAVTNLNVVLKSKAVYSFLLFEITTSRNSKELPDLKVEIGGSDSERKKREREMLEAALARAEQRLKETNQKLESEQPEQELKKETKVAPEDVSTRARRMAESYGYRIEMKAGLTDEKPKEAPTDDGVTPSIDPEVPPQVPRIYKLERNDGVIRATGRAIGRFFRGLNRKLRLF